MNITVVQEPIHIQDTAIIVNSTNADLEWEETTINGDILKEAGPGLLDEFIDRRKLGRMKVGDAFMTSGYGCKADLIYHVLCPWYLMGGELVALQLLYSKIFVNCLAYADTISVPALGTGAFMIPKDQAFAVLLTVLSNDSLLLSKFKEIRFCVPDDTNYNLYKDLIE